MHIDTQAAALQRALGGVKAQDVKVTLKKPISPDLLGKIVRAKVAETLKNGNIRLSLANGKTVEARLEPPLPAGTRVVFSVSPQGDVRLMDVQPPQLPPQQQAHQEKGQQQGGGGKQGEGGGQQASGGGKAPASATVQTARPALTDFLPTNTQPVSRQVPVQVPEQASLPSQTFGPRINVTVTSPPDGQGFQQVLLPLKQEARLNIRPPLPLTEGDALTLRLNSAQSAEVLSIRPQAGSFKIQIVPGVPSSSSAPPATPLGEAPMPASGTMRAVTTPAPPAASVPSATPTPATSTMDAPAPRTELPVQQVKITLPAPLKGQDITVFASKTMTTPAPSGETPVPTREAPTPGMSKTESGLTLTARVSTPPVPQPAVRPGEAPLFRQEVTLPNGMKLPVQTPTPIAENSQMTIRFTTDGPVEVLRIVEPEPIGRHTPHQGQGREGGQAHERPAPPVPLRPGDTLTAKVTAHGREGLHTLTLSDGRTLQVQAGRTLPIGAEVNVKIMADGHAEVAGISLPNANPKNEALLNLSNRWEGLHKALTAARNEDGYIHEKIISRLPGGGGEFLAKLLSFVQAVGDQSVTRFLGDDTVNLLRALGIDLGSDMTSLHSLQSRPDAPQSSGNESWRALFFPYVEGDDHPPHQGAFYWRHNNGEDGERESTRFVVNLSLSQLGRVQIDGLLKRNTIHIKLRLHEMPGPNFEKNLRKIVKETLTNLDFQGDISVDITRHFPVDPLHELLEEDSATGFTI